MSFIHKIEGVQLLSLLALLVIGSVGAAGRFRNPSMARTALAVSAVPIAIAPFALMQSERPNDPKWKKQETWMVASYALFALPTLIVAGCGLGGLVSARVVGAVPAGMIGSVCVIEYLLPICTSDQPQKR